MLDVSCPTCSQTVKFAPEKIGKTVRCFSCGAQFIVEQAGPGEFRIHDVPPSTRAADALSTNRSLSTSLEKTFTAAKITAVAACIIAVCVVVLTVAHFTPKSAKPETVDEKMARYRKVCQEYDRVLAVKVGIDLKRAAAKPRTFAEEKEVYARLYREAGVDPRDVDRLCSEKQALARELGIREPQPD